MQGLKCFILRPRILYPPLTHQPDLIYQWKEIQSDLTSGGQFCILFQDWVADMQHRVFNKLNWAICGYVFFVLCKNILWQKKLQDNLPTEEKRFLDRLVTLGKRKGLHLSKDTQEVKKCATWFSFDHVLMIKEKQFLKWWQVLLFWSFIVRLLLNYPVTSWKLTLISLTSFLANHFFFPPRK